MKQPKHYVGTLTVFLIAGSELILEKSQQFLRRPDYLRFLLARQSELNKYKIKIGNDFGERLFDCDCLYTKTDVKFLFPRLQTTEQLNITKIVLLNNCGSEVVKWEFPYVTIRPGIFQFVVAYE